MIQVIAFIRVKESKLSEFLEIFKANVPAVREEPGCLEYFPAVDVDTGSPVQVQDKNMVIVIEKWQSTQALEDHLQSPHMLRYREKTKDLVQDLFIRVLQEA
ncbi:MAG: antibiotic biosynthesis monooxygenase [Desulfohalobiaceae bacterium]|nr:antibiotic biosynthesis monooxygenase [Desulfohalobiaceae bacterium]